MAVAAALLPVCLYFDLVVASNVHYEVLPGDIRTLLSCAESFGHTYGVCFIVLTVWCASAQNRTKVQTLAGLLIANCLLTFALKNSFMRVRPRGGQAVQFESVWDSFPGINPAITSFDFSMLGISNIQSYPSGHTSTAFVLGIGLALIFPRARYLFLLFSFLAGAQRIGYQAHYLSDVCAGSILGMAVFCVFINMQIGKKLIFGEPEVFPVVAEWPAEKPKSNGVAAA